MFLDNNPSKKSKFVSLLQPIKGVTFPTGVGIQFDFNSQNELDLPGLFKRLDQWAKEHNTKIVIAVDESQEFRKYKHIDMSSIFASVYDNCRNIVLILTGSEIGVLLYDFLKIDDPTAPLFGRSKKEITVKPLTFSQGIEFLTLGLKQQKIKKIDKDVLSCAVNELGGNIGWLNEFGLKCIEKKRVDKKFICDTKKTGSKLARNEFSKFLKGKIALEKYNVIVKNLSIKPLRWTDLKKVLELDLDITVPDKNFSSLLDTLQKSDFIQKIDKLYCVTDPLLKYSFEHE